MAYKKPTTVRLLGERPRRHTRLPHALIRDPEVTANGFRVAAYLLSLADGWEASQRRICVATGLTRDAVGGGMKNLIETGWLVRNEYRNENDYLFKYEYVMNRSHRMGGNPVHMDDETDQWGSEDAWS